ncbi:MAG: putative transposase, partial [Chitinophagaceae bacterium]|nr:putative transposase [Chitinophagaceae bacterium]
MKTRSTYSTAFIVRSSRSKNGLLPIYCRITVNSMRAEFSIQRSVSADQWDNGKVKGTNETAKTLNAYMKEIEGRIFDYCRDMRTMNKLVTADALKNAYLGIKEDEYTLVQLFDYHNKELKETVEWGTMKNYHTTK